MLAMRLLKQNTVNKGLAVISELDAGWALLEINGLI